MENTDNVRSTALSLIIDGVGADTATILKTSESWYILYSFRLDLTAANFKEYGFYSLVQAR